MPVSAIDENCVAQRDVEAVFDDCRRNQHISFVAHEAEHHFFQLAFRHLSMADDHARSRNQFLNFGSYLVDAFYAVMDKVSLSAAFQLMLNRRPDELFVERSDNGLDSHAIFWRRLDYAHVPQPDERHVQSTRDRRCRHRQHINFFLELLKAFLMAYSKALLLIHYEQS